MQIALILLTIAAVGFVYLRPRPGGGIGFDLIDSGIGLAIMALWLARVW